MNRHRALLSILAVTALLFGGAVLAAPPKVEILAMRHPPVRMALAPLRAWLVAQGERLTLVELDVESAPGEQRLREVGLSGHVPIVILINGMYRHSYADGRTIEFVNFPAIDGAPPGVRGAWTAEDVRGALAGRL
jgi:hypothetical protein